VTSQFDDIIQAAAVRYLPVDYDWRLYKAQLYAESGLNPNAVSPAGAVGIAQFIPTAWKEWSKKSGHDGYLATHPIASIFAGAAYMGWLIKNWNSPRPPMDRYCLALASYNSGIGDILDAQDASGGKLLYSEIIAKLPEIEPLHAAEPITYVKRILTFYSQYITG
jgi:membrane-bound lytic murein transglycosylase F